MVVAVPPTPSSATLEEQIRLDARMAAALNSARVRYISAPTYNINKAYADPGMVKLWANEYFLAEMKCQVVRHLKDAFEPIEGHGLDQGSFGPFKPVELGYKKAFDVSTDFIVIYSSNSFWDDYYFRFAD